MTDMPTPVLAIAGEYGATTVELTKDGSCFRLAFGRNQYDAKGDFHQRLFHGAVILSPEAARELAEQIASLGVR